MTWLQELGVEHPIVQAGMGGGISGARLAAAVSEAGGLGTIGIVPPKALRAELREARERTAKPIAINLLLPFTRPAHWEVAREADVIVTFWGDPVRNSNGAWAHQCGSIAEVRAAHDAGADAVIVQGIEAGGHVRGTTPALELLAQAQAILPDAYPLLVAGGIADATDVGRALDAGADGAVLGTRFLLSEESNAHPDYQQRALDADTTIYTELFGQGWPAPHRVIANAATDRWLRKDARGPAWIRMVNRVSAPVSGRLPLSLMPRVAAVQRTAVPVLSPQPPTSGLPARVVDTGALYAGETVARISDIRPAGDIVAALSEANRSVAS